MFFGAIRRSNGKCKLFVAAAMMQNWQAPSYFYYKLCGIKHISRTRETLHAQTDFSQMHSPQHSNRILPVLAKERKWPKTHPTNYLKKPLGFARCKVHGPASHATSCNMFRWILRTIQNVQNTSNASISSPRIH